MFDFENCTVIKDTSAVKYCFFPLTKEQVKELDNDIEVYYKGNMTIVDFKNKWGVAPTIIIMHGDVSDVDSNILHPYIDNVDIKQAEDIFRKSYKCFSGEAFGLDYTKQILHGSALDSWNCLMIKLENCKYGAILNLFDYEKSV